MSRMQDIISNCYRPKWWTRSVYPYLSEDLVEDIIYSYFRKTSQDGFDLMDEDWDNCFLLDACRYDMFADLNPFEGRFEHRISKASSTPGFLEANFSGKQHYDTVYVTANPMHAIDEWCDVTLDDVFHATINVWETEWNTDVGTVPPQKMATAVREANKTYPNKRLLAHFIQPHHPFIGPTGEKISDSGMQGRKKAMASSDEVANHEEKVWEQLKRGNVSKQRVWKAYRENLELTLPHIQTLLDNIDGKSVITSDHGNLVADWLWPFPKRGYGHPGGLLAPQLIKVPWVVLDNNGRKTVRSNRPVESGDSHESDEIRDRLADLGYRS